MRMVVSVGVLVVMGDCRGVKKGLATSHSPLGEEGEKILYAEVAEGAEAAEKRGLGKKR